MQGPWPGEGVPGPAPTGWVPEGCLVDAEAARPLLGCWDPCAQQGDTEVPGRKSMERPTSLGARVNERQGRVLDQAPTLCPSVSVEEMPVWSSDGGSGRALKLSQCVAHFCEVCVARIWFLPPLRPRDQEQATAGIWTLAAALGKLVPPPAATPPCRSGSRPAAPSCDVDSTVPRLYSPRLHLV